MEREVRNIIRESIDSNFGRNIFIRRNGELPMGNILYNYIKENKGELEKLKSEIDSLSEFTKREIINLIIRTNQYVLITYDLEEKLFNMVKSFYTELFNSDKDFYMEEIFYKYQISIISLLENIDELKTMDKGKEEIDIVPCSEYSPEHQIRILQMDLESLKEPILDIGCGKSGELVQYLRDLGFKAYGIDREINREENFLEKLSWFDKNFKADKWGTIISHLSFTNHFKREHFKKGDGHIIYAKKYMEILKSLKKGGSFYYTPNLEFIEQFMIKDEFQIEVNKIKESDGIGSVKITKISNLN